MGGPKKLYNNQKHISFRNELRNKNNPYNEYNRSALQEAICTLSHSALKIYLYFGNFRNLSSGIYLSKQDVLNSVDISEKSYFSAMKELKEKGYILNDTTSQEKDHFIFFESPQHW